MSEQNWKRPLDALELGRLHSIVVDGSQPQDRRYVAAERVYHSHKALEAKLETMEKRLEEMRREVRRSAEDIFDAVAAAQEEEKE